MIVTGRDGWVNGIPCIQSWGFDKTGSNARYAASCTGRGTAVTSGNVNYAGSIAGIGGSPAVIPGTTVSFKGISDNTPGQLVAYDGDIQINSLSINCPKEAGTEITWTANFGVQGELTKNTTVAGADATFARHLGASIAADAQLGDAGTLISFPGFRGWTLNINAPEKTYVLDGLTYRLPGNLEADLSIDVYDNDPNNARWDINAVDKVRLYIDAVNYWLVEWAVFTGATGLVVNRGTQDIQGYTINAMWTATNAGAQGHITRPDGTHLYGV